MNMLNIFSKTLQSALVIVAIMSSANLAAACSGEFTSCGNNGVCIGGTCTL